MIKYDWENNIDLLENELQFKLKYVKDNNVWRGHTTSAEFKFDFEEELPFVVHNDGIFHTNPRKFEVFYAISKYYDSITIREIVKYITSSKSNIDDKNFSTLEHHYEVASKSFNDSINLKDFFKKGLFIGSFNVTF